MEQKHQVEQSDTTCDLTKASFPGEERDNRRAREVDIDYDSFEYDEVVIGCFIRSTGLEVAKERRELIVQGFRQLKGKNLPKIGIFAEILQDYVEDWSLGRRQLREIQRIALDSLMSFNSLNPKTEGAILEWHRIYCYAHKMLNPRPPYRKR